MTFTKRTTIMFILFTFELAYVMFSAALSANLNVIISSLSILLFLGSLYLDRNMNSRYATVISACMIIVSFILGSFSNLSFLFTVGGIIQIFLYVALYFFAVNTWYGQFHNKQKNIAVIVMSSPMVALGLFSIFSLSWGAFQYQIDMISLIFLILTLIETFILPLAMILYTVFRWKHIE